jgi:hypothetical protein
MHIEIRVLEHECEHCACWQRFVDDGVLTNVAFKPKHTSIHWILPWGIEMLVVLGDKKVLRLVDWLVNAKIHNNGCKTLHTHMAKIKKCGFIKNKVVECIVKTSVEKATLIPPHPCHPWDWWACKDGAKPITSRCDLQGSDSFHQICLLHIWTGITWKLVQTPSCYSSYMYWFHQGKYYSILWDMVWIQSWRYCCHVWHLTYLHLYDNE